MQWEDGPIYCLLRDGSNRVIGRLMKVNCCNWVAYDGRRVTNEYAAGTQLPGVFQSIVDGKRKLEAHIEANPE